MGNTLEPKDNGIEKELICKVCKKKFKTIVGGYTIKGPRITSDTCKICRDKEMRDLLESISKQK